MKRRLAWTGVVLGALGTAFLLLCGAVATFSPDVPWPPSAWTPPAGAYRVAVMGDIQKGLSNAKALVEELRKAGVCLTLQTGDLVSSNDDGHYRLAARALRNLPGSFRAVPGNHDVKGAPDRFLQAFGALEFTVDAGPLSFVGLDNAFGESIDVPKLEAMTAGKEAVVLLFHAPRFGPAFVEWLEKSPRVKYVFCGHAHEYSERTIGSTTVIVNGIGGDYDAWQLNREVKGVVLEIEGSSIRHRTITLAPTHGLWDNLEHLAIGHLGAWAWAGAALAGALTLFCKSRTRRL